MLFFQIAASILFIYSLIANGFMIIRAFLRGYDDWGWRLTVAFIANMLIVFLWVGNIEAYFLRGYLIFVFLTISIVLPTIVYRIAKLPDAPPLPCKACGEEVMTKRKVAVNLDNHEVVTPRSTLLVLLLTGGVVTLAGIWLLIFTIQSDHSVFGAAALTVFGFSLVGTHLRGLVNKPKNLGLGYFYKCKNCNEKWAYPAVSSQS